jgi:hypothetical protein
VRLGAVIQDRPGAQARRNSFGASGTAIAPRLSRRPGKPGGKANSVNGRRAHRLNEMEEELPAASWKRNSLPRDLSGKSSVEPKADSCCAKNKREDEVQSATTKNNTETEEIKPRARLQAQIEQERSKTGGKNWVEAKLRKEDRSTQ